MDSYMLLLADAVNGSAEVGSGNLNIVETISRDFTYFFSEENAEKRAPLISDLIKILVGLILVLPGAVIALLTYLRSVRNSYADVIIKLHSEYQEHHEVFLELEDPTKTSKYSNAIYFSMLPHLEVMYKRRLSEKVERLDFLRKNKSDSIHNSSSMANLDSEIKSAEVEVFEAQAMLRELPDRIDRYLGWIGSDTRREFEGDISRLESALRFLYVCKRLSDAAIRRSIVEKLVGYTLMTIVDLERRNEPSRSEMGSAHLISPPDRRAIRKYVQVYWPSLFRWAKTFNFWRVVPFSKIRFLPQVVAEELRCGWVVPERKHRRELIELADEWFRSQPLSLN